MKELTPEEKEQLQAMVDEHRDGTQTRSVESYAGFWMRFVASIIDGILTGVVTYGIRHLLPMSSLLGLLFGWLYFALMESSRQQGTLGKALFGITVTDMNGNRISFGRATGRHFGKIISALMLNIGFIMAGFTKKKQALHDSMADCLVMIKE